PLWSPFVLSKQTESQLADFTQLFFGQALRPEWSGRGASPSLQETAPRGKRLLTIIEEICK
ncbi:hypothetical protein E0H66_31680, partial [Rhizobium leguminosarum bv. viciae]